MKNQTSLLRWAGFFALALVVLALAGPSAHAASKTESAGAEKLADVITFNAIAAHGELSLSPSTFLYYQSTNAV